MLRSRPSSIMRTTRHLLPLASLLALSLPIAGCGPDAPQGPLDGAGLYGALNCATCHKDDGRGGALGPTLRNKAEYWSREALAEYLIEPTRFIDKDARLKSLEAQYNVQMPGAPSSLAREQVLMLADFVLSLSDDE
jgi:hypothetical protein